MQIRKLSAGDPLDGPKPWHVMIVKQRLGFAVWEETDHAIKAMTRRVICQTALQRRRWAFEGLIALTRKRTPINNRATQEGRPNAAGLFPSISDKSLRRDVPLMMTAQPEPEIKGHRRNDEVQYDVGRVVREKAEKRTVAVEDAKQRH